MMRLSHGGGYSDVKDRVGTVSRRHRISSGYSEPSCWSFYWGFYSLSVEPASRDIAPLHYGRGSVYVYTAVYAAGITDPVDSQAMRPRHWFLAQWRASFRR